MSEIGVRELKARASQIIRSVRDQRARYIVTHRGRPVGVLIPLEEAHTTPLATSGESTVTAWEELTRLGEEIGREWRSSQTSTELLAEMRR